LDSILNRRVREEKLPAGKAGTGSVNRMITAAL
jgi:hypothetical protein